MNSSSSPEQRPGGASAVHIVWRIFCGKCSAVMYHLTLLPCMWKFTFLALCLCCASAATSFVGLPWSQYEKYIHWDESNPTKYTRNVVFCNEYMDVLLMCWPPHSTSSIHDHEEASCWVTLVSGRVHEVQYAMPTFDRKFVQSQMRNPTGAVGRCGPLRVTSVSELSAHGSSSTYANNEIGLHRVENRTDQPAYTLHVYAPGLRKMTIFKECGSVSICCVAAPPIMSCHGQRTGHWTSGTDPDGKTEQPCGT